MSQIETILPEEIIVNKIYFIRNTKVMIDRDLAEIYGVETRVLNQAVSRNISRFPEDFMFQLTDQEFDSLMSQIVISNKGRGGTRKLPYAFSEQGVAMLSSVINSERAIQVNIRIIRVFTKMRQLLESHKEILLKLEQLQTKDTEQDQNINLIFEYLKQFEKFKNDEQDQKNRKRIGFKQD